MGDMRLVSIIIAVAILGCSPAGAEDCAITNDRYSEATKTTEQLLDLVRVRRVAWDEVMLTDANRAAYETMRSASAAILTRLESYLDQGQGVLVEMQKCLLNGGAYSEEQLRVLAGASEAGRALIPLLVDYLTAYEGLPD